MNGIKFTFLRRCFLNAAIAVVFVALVAPAHAARAKRVLILDFKNLDQNPNYQYLEGSITDAVTNALKARFDFREMPGDTWRALAVKQSFRWSEENYGRGFALYLGRVAKQDIAIGGYFKAIGRVIRVHVFMLDVGKQNMVSEFDVMMPVSAALFTAVEKLATRVADEAKVVLPNKGTLPVESYDDDTGPDEIGIVGGIGIIGVPAAYSGNYTTSTPLYAKDFVSPINAAAFYARHDFIFPQWMLHGMAGAQFGSSNLPVATDTRKISAKLLDIYAALHLGYEFKFWRMAVTPLMGGGFSYANIKLDYTTLSALPITASGEQRSSAAVNISAPFAEAGLRIAFAISGNIHVLIYSLYRQSFYIENSVGQLFGAGGISLRF